MSTQEAESELVERLRERLIAFADNEEVRCLTMRKAGDEVLITSWTTDPVDRITRLEAENEKLRAAISWIEHPFVDANTPVSELRKRVQFCVADAKRARTALGGGGQ